MIVMRAGMRKLLPTRVFPLLKPRSILPISPPFPARTMASHSPSTPRRFPTSGFAVLASDVKVEEEGLPSYKPEDYYPVEIGQVLMSRYQIVSKLGFGISSTVWLCRDLLDSRFLSLKVCTSKKRQNNEIAVSSHLMESSVEHPGKPFVRTVLDSFDITSPTSGERHQCLLYHPLGMSFTELLDLLPEHRFPEPLLQRSMQLILIGLEYLHQAGVVHTDISANNVLQGISDPSALADIEHGEMDQPIARKVLVDRTVYNSRPMPMNKGLPVLCDFGEARIGSHGQKHKGDVMPGIYRAPEVILGMEWDYKLDIWSIGVTVWDLLEGGNLFFAKKDGILNDEQHLAEMVSLLGPPPLEFIRRSEKCLQYWDEQANWKGSIPIPEQSFEIRERHLQGESRTFFLHFLRMALAWLPEERLPAEDLARHAFLMQPLVAENGAEQYS